MGKSVIVEQTPLSIFVRERLAELGIRQSEFCRLTGFDQGLLSKIQSSMVTNLSLESVLRLSMGLGVSPKRVINLIGRSDLHELIMRSYANELPAQAQLDGADLPEPVLEISRLAYRAHMMGRNLTPVLRILCSMAALSRDQVQRHASGKFI
ncbi:MAG TPA: helix-turn-helix domain-containing protein [Blastocatellia bacterium]|nr:helix-turn-helix domain-containing protein [Blastocatellia bacterium]